MRVINLTPFVAQCHSFDEVTELRLIANKGNRLFSPSSFMRVAEVSLRNGREIPHFALPQPKLLRIVNKIAS